MSQRRIFSIVTAFAAFFALSVAFLQPMSKPMPVYAGDMREWAATGHISDTFTPLAYPLFAAPAFRLAGFKGVAVLQALLCLAIFGFSLRLLRQLHLPPAWAAFGAIVVLLHPDLFLSIAKIWDVPLSTALLFLLVSICLHLQERITARAVIALGIVFGLGLFCRPNYAFLLAPIVYAFLTTRSSRPGPRRTVIASAAVVSIASAVFALLGVASYGSPFFPHNGPYNLFAGNNPYSASALLEHLNAEPSISAGIGEDYPNLAPSFATTGYYTASLAPLYTHQALLFARTHPLSEVRLVAIKLVTFFRPDTKVHPLLSPSGLCKLLLALPAPVLLALLLKKRSQLGPADRLLLIAYAAYVVPFLLTNSDPRFRIPLDALMLLHIVRLVYLRQGPHADEPVHTRVPTLMQQPR